MIKPGTPVPMWAVHDKTLDTFSFPLATHEETRAVRDAQLAAMDEPRRVSLFPVTAVDVVITPRQQTLQPDQPALFTDGEAAA